MAELITKGPSAHSQPSRKGKKAWRKNVDLSEVERGLDTVRDEIIQGGVVAEKPSEELFTTDVIGDKEVEKKQQQRVKKPLKADEILGRRSAIPALEGRKRKIEELHVPSGKKQRNGTYVPYKELQRLWRVADNTNGVQIEAASNDPWAVQTVPESQRQLDFLEPPKSHRIPKTLKQAPAPLTANGRPVSHVRKPDAGKSYNPDVDDWSALFQREGAAEVERERTRLAEAAADAEKEARALAEAAKVEAAEQAAYGTDYESGWESEWDGIQSGAEDNTSAAAHTSKAPRRKTQAERNKTKARKEREARETWERKQRARDEQERRIKAIAHEVRAVEKAREDGRKATAVVAYESSDSDENEGGEVRLRRERFGLATVPDAPLEVTLPEELQDSLRRLRPEGNLLTDRYRNLLINGKLEVRRRAPERRKKKTFRTEKWSYKDWKLK